MNEILNGTYYYFDCMDGLIGEQPLKAAEVCEILHGRPEDLTEKQLVSIAANYEATLYRQEYTAGELTGEAVLYDCLDLTGGADIKEFDTDTVLQLEGLEAAVYDKYNVTSRPAGKLWVYMVLDLIRDLTDRPELLTATGPAELDALTNENFHTLRTAAEIALNLNQQSEAGQAAPESWLVFTDPQGRELCAYTLRGSFPGEREATIGQLAAERGLDPADIQTKIVKK